MPDTDPTRIVADADVLAAALLVGGSARQALDVVRAHSWLTLVASDPLLDDTQAVITTLADADLAADWRGCIETEREAVDHPEGDHPGLASAYNGNAAHLLSFDDGLSSTGANISLQGHMNISIRTPDAFATLFDAKALYEAVHDGTYPGPDRDVS